jgi:hypothetical protein
MRTKIVVFALVTCELVRSQSFSLGTLVVMRTNHLIVNAKGTPDAATLTQYTSSAHYGDWHVSATDSKAGSVVKIPIYLTDVRWFAANHRFYLTYDPGPLAGRNPHEFDWSLAYMDNAVPLTSPAATFGFSPAASKDKADVYLLGSYLAGDGTKPIYSIDLELNWLPEIHQGLFFGLQSCVLVNSSATPPVNRSSVDPDSITAGLPLRTMLFHNEVALDASLARGEFSRKNNDSSFVPSLMLKWIRDPWPIAKRQFAVLYPSVGIEGGENLNKPSTIMGQNVDFSRYNGIFRGVPSAYAAYYVGRPKPDPTNPYLFEFYTRYTARILATREPFITSRQVNGQSQASITLGTNTRHYVESGILWNASDYVGLQAKYTYGSLPPLFQFVDNQITVGVTFKANLPGH